MTNLVIIKMYILLQNQNVLVKNILIKYLSYLMLQIYSKYIQVLTDHLK